MKIPLLALALLATLTGNAAAFSFSEEEQNEKAASDAARQRHASLLATPCKQALKDKRIMVVVGQRTAKGMLSDQGSFSAHFQAIDKRLKRLGLNSISQEEMKAKVAQAEIDAYLNNDMEAALNASKKMTSDFILRGVISSRTGYNQMVRLPEVYVSMSFTLTGADGRMISEASGAAESYSNSDVGGMAVTLINEQAEGVVARLYSDYCRKAGIGGKNKK
ncbi:MAG TPA: hypothetical protein PKD04_05455 [Rhodocyclaceae bacterium]|jgi:hypothetical protein|nr:hypothetical protein [Betaproteobacteria bacterium]HMV00508.1 hypothetical protein [Rhodocyclaceae bacterium]HMV21959.1 hypothetical protein [Rhodocyclaceae bacterium]HMW76888.1 hypothetical protein [Rhodocyclaceae bacterium]HNE42507.1 hypothetical protein [Rhodocyclaceae bacterium]